MPVTIANYFDCPRWSCTAGEDMADGMVIKIVDNSGARKAMKLANADGALLVQGGWGVVWKVAPFADEVEVVDASVNVARTGNRAYPILSGDAVVQVGRGAILEITADLLHSSLDPARGGTTPAANASLSIVGSQFCAAGTASSIASTASVGARVHKTIGTNVFVELY
jgi:hypothetical protein